MLFGAPVALAVLALPGLEFGSATNCKSARLRRTKRDGSSLAPSELPAGGLAHWHGRDRRREGEGPQHSGSCNPHCLLKAQGSYVGSGKQ